MTEGNKAPFGVVIPSFGHPKFLAEAIISACEQKIDRPVRVVVVDDGCRFEETGEIVSHLLPKYSGSLFYIRQKNTRLPGARNSGIRFLLNLEPALEAIYLLDSDNRLSFYSLDVFWRALGDDPKTGWAYPDISFFGLTRGNDGFDTRETAPSYSVLKHLVGNISEAGSMIRADVFRSGVMFDETMTAGFEDWEFWLSALDAGYHGVRAVDTGFLYRGRPESMLADTSRLSNALVDIIQAKHPMLYHPKHVMQLEHKEAPSFALFIPEDDHLFLMSDPQAEPHQLSYSEFRYQFHAWARNSIEHFFPTHILIIPKAIWAELQKQIVFLRWWFWNIREKCNGFMFIKFLESLEIMAQLTTEEQPDSNIFCIDTGYLWRKAQDHNDSECLPGTQLLNLTIPELGGLKLSSSLLPQGFFFEKFEHLTSLLFPIPQYIKHTSKTFFGPDARTVRASLVQGICAFAGREAFPACKGVGRTVVAFNADFLNNGPALKKIVQVLEAHKRPDREIIVLLEGAEHVSIPSYNNDWLTLVDDVVPLIISDNELEHSVYLGRRFKRELLADISNDVAIIARTSDQIIVCGIGATIEAIGEVKQHGAQGSVFLAPEFVVPEVGASLGFAKLLAFEHAVSYVITDDVDYRISLTAEGFPNSKLVGEESYLNGLNLSE